MAINNQLKDNQIEENVQAIREQGGNEVQVRSYLNAVKKDNLYQPLITPEEEGTGNFLPDVGVGVAKSVGEMGLGLGTIGRSIQSKLPSFMQGFGKGAGETGTSVFDAGSTENQAATDTLQRNTAGEKVGGFVGDVASFAIPGGAAVKATKGASFLTRAAALGASDALTTTVRQGEFDRNSVDSAIIGAAFPVVGKAAGALKKAVLPTGKDAGGRVINSLIKPLLKDFSYGKNPGSAVAEAGIVANSLDDLAVKIGKARGTAGEEIASKISGVSKRFDATDALKPLDKAIEAAKKNPRTNSTIIKRLEDTRLDLLKVGEDGLPTRNLSDLSADELWSFNKEIGELARWTDRGTDDEVVNRAIQGTYRLTRGKLDDAVDGLKPLSEKYANLKTAEQAAIYRDKIAARQGLIS